MVTGSDGNQKAVETAARQAVMYSSNEQQKKRGRNKQQ